MTIQRKRRRIRFFRISLRTLLVLMLLAGLACGWVAMKREQSRRQAESVAALIELSPEQLVTGLSSPHRFGDRRDLPWWDRHPSQPVVMFDSGTYGSRQPRGRFLPAWLRRVTGEECFHKVIAVHLAGGKIAKDHLDRLATFRHLQSLNIDDADLGPGGLQQIGRLKQLKRLCLGENAISDVEIRHLAHLTQLQELELWHNPITDSGLSALTSLKRLKRLNLCSTQVTSKGVNRLQQALPECKIWWDDCETFRFIGKTSLIEPNPVDIVRAVNHLHSLGKHDAVLALKEYTRLYDDKSLTGIVPLLFPNASSQSRAQDNGWPRNFSTVQVAGEVPFYSGGFLEASHPRPITTKVVEWLAKNCKLRKKPLHPTDDPFAQAKRIHAKLCEKLGSELEWIESLPEHLKAQAERMVSHLDLDDPANAKLRWNDERQEYVLAED